MELLFDDGLYRVGGTREQSGAGWSYLLRREGGNLLLVNLAGSSVAALEPDFPAIEALGGLGAMFFNDRHNAYCVATNRIVSNSFANDCFPCFELDAAARERILGGMIADLQSTDQRRTG